MGEGNNKDIFKFLLLLVACHIFLIASASNLSKNENVDKTPFSTAIAKLWKNAEKKQVMKIGNQILQKDSQNIIGLLIKMEYEISYLEFNKLEKTMNSIQKNINEGRYSSKNLKKQIPLLKKTIQVLSTAIKKYPQEEREIDLKKANLKGKDLSCINIIKAAEEDGLLPKGIDCRY